MENFLSSFIVATRESLEAFVIVFIMIKFISNSKKQQNKKSFLFLMIGSCIGLILAIILGVSLYYLNKNSWIKSHPWFDFILQTIILGASIYFIVWMFKGKMHAKEAQVKIMNAKSFHISLLLFGLITLFREGSEIVTLTYSEQNIWGILSGAFLALTIFFILVFFLKKPISPLVMKIFMVILILVTSPILMKWVSLFFKLVHVKDSIIIYKWKVDTIWEEFFYTILRGVLGIKHNLNISGLLSQLIWDGGLITLYFYTLRREKKTQEFSEAKIN